MDNPLIHHTTKNDDLSKLQSPSKIVLKKTSISSQFCLPTSIIALLIIILLSYNSFTIFCFIPLFSMENDKEIEHKLPTSKSPSSSISNYAMKYKMSNKETLPLISKTTIIHVTKTSHATTTRQVKHHIPRNKVPSIKPLTFAKRVRLFFNQNSCKFRVFMTWISLLDSFGEREKYTIESLFKFNPNACLLIVSNSMDSINGTKILDPFLRLNLKVMAVSPDYKFIFKNTMADDWYNQLEKGDVRPGEISLGQNLSNLLRLALLYKYGGVYMDTDFIVLKRLDTLKNVIGAQTSDPYTKHWSRLNNALMIFDKNHPLLNKFIEEFALTFNGNKWGHNGPYLVSRVIERVNNNRSIIGKGEFTILPPTAFYVVDWARIGSLFKKPVDENHLKWINEKLNQIGEESYAVHLWNRESREVKVEDGSIIGHLMERSCIFCDFSRPTS